MQAKRAGRSIADALRQDHERMEERIEAYARRKRACASLPPTRRAVEERMLQVEKEAMREDAAILDRIIRRENAAREARGLRPVV
jgi:hypothetical protein